MNYLKNLFTPDDFETVFQKEIEVNPTYLHLSRNQWKFLIVKIDKTKKKVLCYLTDGELRITIDINVVTMVYPEVIEILINNKIKW
jgi:hypothetical protein